MSKAKVDVERINHQFRKDTDSKLKDAAFNWILDRYTKNKHAFTFSDRFVWTGAVYTIPEIFGYIVFFAIFYFLGNLSLTRYGEPRTYMFFALLILWRLNMQVKYLAKLNTKLA